MSSGPWGSSRNASYRGQRNYPGMLWTATTQSLVGYESLLERDRLCWPTSTQPCGGRQPAVLGVRPRRVGHPTSCFPASCSRWQMALFTVVEVKPEAMIDEPVVADFLA
jgi:hypothetical protein